MNSKLAAAAAVAVASKQVPVPPPVPAGMVTVTQQYRVLREIIKPGALVLSTLPLDALVTTADLEGMDIAHLIDRGALIEEGLAVAA